MKIIVPLLAVLSFAAPALAQTAFTQPPGGHRQGADRGPGAPDGHRGPGGPEGPGGPDRMFAMMDANHDGVVSRAEFDAFHARMREMHRDGRGPHGGPRGDGPPPPGE